MTNSETKNFSQNVSSSYHLEDRGKCNKNTCTNTCNVPKLRFKGYNDEWKHVKIGEIYKERSERGNTDAELLSVTMNDGVKRRIDIEGKDISSEDKSNYKSVYIGDMVYNSMRMWQGANGISNYDGIVSPAYTVMFPKTKLIKGSETSNDDLDINNSIFLHMTDGIIAFDRDGKIVLINPAAQKMMNVLPEHTNFDDIFGKLHLNINLEKIIYLEN